MFSGSRWAPKPASGCSCNYQFPGRNVHDSYSLLACLGYIIVLAFIGVRWLRWNTR